MSLLPPVLQEERQGSVLDRVSVFLPVSTVRIKRYTGESGCFCFQNMYLKKEDQFLVILRGHKSSSVPHPNLRTSEHTETPETRRDRSVEYFLFPQLEAQNPPAVVLLDPLDDTGAGLNETFSPNTTR